MKNEIRKYIKVTREIRNTWPLFQYRNHVKNKDSSFRSHSVSNKLNADSCSEGHMTVFLQHCKKLASEIKYKCILGLDTVVFCI
jgi:hypothetical protein